MQENNFSHPGEMRQFLIAFLTTVIVLSCYHLGNSIITSLEEHSAPRNTILHCYIHNGDRHAEEEEEEEEKTQQTTAPENQGQSIARNSR